MKIGYAQAVITPSLAHPVYLAGFGNNRRAQTIHDDLYARALALQGGPATLVLVALDLIGFFRPDVRAVIEMLKTSEAFRVLSPHIIIAATHTHHGPDTLGLWGPDSMTRGVDDAYLSAVKKTIADTILASLSVLRPASAKWTSVHVPRFVKNFRDPGIVDDELTLVQFVNEPGAPLATMAIYPCHPEVLWNQNPHLTSDYPGYLRRAIEAQTGAPCLFFVGALGGMLSPDFPEGQHTFENAELMGCGLAQAGLAALAAVPHADATVSVQRKEIKAPLTNILYKLAFWRKLLPDVRDASGCLNTEVNLIRLGGLWLATVPGELLPRLGLQLKAWLKDAGAEVAGIIGLANDELGYILPVEDFKYPWNPFRPGRHYEETNSIGKDIAPRVMEGLKALL
jgi:hypothetical protein